MSKEFEQVAPLPDVYRGWRDQLDFYRRLAENMKDQSRSIETPDGWEQGPRAIVDHAIRDAERAAEDGDIDGFALHIQQAVEVFIHADFDEVALPAVRWNNNRSEKAAAANDATDRHELWRAMAADIRERNKDLKSKLAIAQIIAKRLSESSDPEERQAARSADMISRII